MVMADDIKPLRGEGRTVGPIAGLWGELLSEFLGTFERPPCLGGRTESGDPREASLRSGLTTL